MVSKGAKVDSFFFSRFYIGGGGGYIKRWGKGEGKGRGEFDYGNDRIRRKNEEFGFMVKFQRPLNICRVARANSN